MITETQKPYVSQDRNGIWHVFNSKGQIEESFFSMDRAREYLHCAWNALIDC
jgi:hypothetical protein